MGLYHAYVRRQVRCSFRVLSAVQLKRHLERFALDAELCVHGIAPGCGRWQGQRSIAASFRRLYADLPHHDFTIEDVWVQGGPGNTTVAVAWTDHAYSAAGTPVGRRGMNRIRLRWGRVVAEDVFVGAAAD